MKKPITAVIASVILGTSVIAPPASAQRYQDRDRFIERYCGNNWDSDCQDWRANRRSWDRDRYDRWYGRHRQEFGPEDAAAAVFGFAAGAITGSIAGAVGGSHVAACEARYRSYNPETDMYRGYDGDWRYCRL